MALDQLLASLAGSDPRPHLPALAVLHGTAILLHPPWTPVGSFVNSMNLQLPSHPPPPSATSASA
eukprot:11203760-Lingulodinium_polyedra.AAC.1